jgi:DNA-binding response OmpR family regulator
MVPSHPLCHITIVIVEDHPDTQTFLSDFLTRLGARVIKAGDAETALQGIQECHPNVVLSDLGLPRKSGFELLDEIRRLDSDDRRVPVIAMTALGGIVERQRAIAAGFQELLRKPFGPTELLRALQLVLR